MVLKPIETPSVLNEDLWVRVQQSRATEPVQPVPEEPEREEGNEQRRDRFERQFPPRGAVHEVPPEEEAPVIERVTIEPPRVTLRSLMGAPVTWVGTQLTLPGMETVYARPQPSPPETETGSTLDLEA